MPLLQLIIPLSHVEPRTYKIIAYYHPLSLLLTHPIKPYARYIPSVKNLSMQNRLQHLPLFHIFHRLVDFFEWIEFCQSVEEETPFFLYCDQFRDSWSGMASPLKMPLTVRPFIVLSLSRTAAVAGATTPRSPQTPRMVRTCNSIPYDPSALPWSPASPSSLPRPPL